MHFANLSSAITSPSEALRVRDAAGGMSTPGASINGRHIIVQCSYHMFYNHSNTLKWTAVPGGVAQTVSGTHLLQDHLAVKLLCLADINVSLCIRRRAFKMGGYVRCHKARLQADVYFIVCDIILRT